MVALEVGYSVIAASSSVDGPTGDSPAHLAIEQRIIAAANIRTAYEPGPRRPTYRSIFDSRVKKSSRLYVDKLGWSHGHSHAAAAIHSLSVLWASQ